MFKILHNQRFLPIQLQGSYDVYDNYKQKKTKESNNTGALVCLLLATSMDVLSTVF